MTDPDIEEQSVHNQETQAIGQASASATQAAMQTVDHIRDQDFADKLGDADLDSRKFDWLTDELGPAVSGAHTRGNRGRDYEQWVRYGNEVEAMRVIAEHSPGRVLREHPKALAVMQGAHRRADDPTDWESIREVMREPMTSQAHRAIEESYEVSTNIKTLSIGATGGDLLTTARTENIIRRPNDTDDSGGVRERLSNFIG